MSVTWAMNDDAFRPLAKNNKTSPAIRRPALLAEWLQHGGAELIMTDIFCNFSLLSFHRDFLLSRPDWENKR